MIYFLFFILTYYLVQNGAKMSISISLSPKLHMYDHCAKFQDAKDTKTRVAERITDQIPNRKCNSDS